MLSPAGYGGIHHYGWLLSGELERRGHHVAFAAAQGMERLSAPGPSEEIALPPGRGPRAYPSQSRVVLRHVERFDVLHFQSPLWSALDPWWLLPRARRRGGPLLTATVHNVLPHRKLIHHRIAYERFYSLLDGVAVHSEAHLKALPGRPQRLEMTPFGDHGPAMGEPDEGSAPRRRLGLDDEQTVVLFFGQIRPNKGLLDLIRALEGTAAEGVHLLVAGDPQEPLGPYEEEAQRLGVRVVLDPWYLRYLDGPAVAACFMGSDFVVLPYRAGWNSGVLSLAAHYGKPTIATTAVAPPEDLARLPAPGVCPAGDVAALKRAVRAALDGQLEAPSPYPGWDEVATAHLRMWTV